MQDSLSASSTSMGLRPLAARACAALWMNASLNAFSLAPLPQPQMVASLRPGDGRTFMNADMISLQSLEGIIPRAERWARREERRDEEGRDGGGALG